MKVDLISFQEKAVKELRLDIAEALGTYQRRNKTQVVSLQAPTGAGKTIIAAALIENIYFGTTLADGTTYTEQPEAIFVWLSDSPELNEQSKAKIELKTSKLRLQQVKLPCFSGVSVAHNLWIRLFLKKSIRRSL